MKYLGINLTKEMKYVYSENYKTSMTEFDKKEMEIYSCILDLE